MAASLGAHPQTLRGGTARKGSQAARTVGAETRPTGSKEGIVAAGHTADRGQTNVVSKNHKVGKDEPCPCDSGKKYRHCCLGKGFTWERDSEGQLYRTMPLSPELVQLLEQNRRSFIAKHGREPRPDEPLFPELAKLAPGEFEEQVAEAMEAAGIDKAQIHAFRQTGLILTEDNQKFVPDVELEEFKDAVSHYRAMQN